MVKLLTEVPALAVAVAAAVAAAFDGAGFGEFIYEVEVMTV